MPRTLPVSRLIGTLTLATTVNLGAEESAMEKLRSRLKSAEQYGTECCQMLSIPAAAFQVSGNEFFEPSIFFDSLGYAKIFPAAWAPVSLPTGAVLDFIDYCYFRESAGDTCARLKAYSGPTLLGAPPAEETVGQTCSSGVEGYGYAIEELTGTIDNSVWFSGGAQYAVLVTSDSLFAPFPSVFKGVTIWWHREVRPASGTATFNDVPTNHPQFQFIEALADSGITVGCGGGNFCPDSPLTRGQMAVFLSKALGLYWPF